MSSNVESTDTQSYWFVGAAHNNEDQRVRLFLGGITLLIE